MFNSQEKLFKTSKCDSCYYYEEHDLGMDGTVDICYAQNRKEFLGGVILNKNYKNNIKCDKYKSCKQHYKEINKKLKIYEELEQQLGCDLGVVIKALLDGGIIDNYELGCQLNGVVLDGSGNIYLSAVNGDLSNVKDYQKTWWLASDKKEKQNDN